MSWGGTGLVIRRKRLALDWRLVFSAAALCAVGLSTLFSAVDSPTSQALPREFVQQGIWLALGTVALIISASIDPRVYERLAYPIWTVITVLLALVPILGVARKGSTRWIPIGPIHLQPSELMKIGLILALARWFASRHRDDGWGLRESAFPAVLFLGLPAVLVFTEPDLGTTMMLVFIFSGLMFVVGLRWRTLAAILLVGTLSLPLAYTYALKPYQRARVDTVIHPEADADGKGYQSIQGKWAIGSGQVWGKGWREGTQGRLRFLPEHHTDFIFAVYSEERGFIGSAALILLYLWHMVLGLSIAWNARDRFASLLAAGVVCIFAAHFFVNLGAVLGVLPVTGVTLPFLSYGGSSVLTMMTGVGLLLSVSMRTRRG